LRTQAAEARTGGGERNRKLVGQGRRSVIADARLVRAQS
jgi:hypothetical protein